MNRKIGMLLLMMTFTGASLAEELPGYLPTLLKSGKYQLVETFTVSEFMEGHVIASDEGRLILYSLPNGMLMEGTLLGVDGAFLSEVHKKEYLGVSQASTSKTSDYEFQQGSGDKEAVIFFDPMCPACKHLYQELIPYESEVKVTWKPVSIFNGSENTTASIFRDDNPAQAFRFMMQGGQLQPVTANQELLDAMHINMGAMRGQGLEATPSGYLIIGEGQRRYFQGANIDNIIY
ncbi:MAG: hypothetical protein C9356_12240 [Oleiphilus sp.]|nr:MAG: hypothetical protein C9356_12240 [Oleiphilus sp.]